MTKRKRFRLPSHPLSPQQTQEAQRGQIVIAGQTTTFSGPLPPPQLIKGYEEAVPGAGDRIIRMAETEQSHRHKHEVRELKAITFVSVVGQFFGFLLGVSGIAGSVFLIYSGRAGMGFAVFVGSLGSLVAAYVWGRKQPK